MKIWNVLGVQGGIGSGWEQMYKHSLTIEIFKTHLQQSLYLRNGHTNITNGLVHSNQCCSEL